MTALSLHEFHRGLNGAFVKLNDAEVVDHYGNVLAEHAALRTSAGVIDLSFRSRLCVTGADRQRFLNGQVTNDVKLLKTGEGCYAVLVSAKGRIQSDLNIYVLDNEILLDFEPGYSGPVTQRLEKYIIADDVAVTDVAAQYGVLSVQGPATADVVRSLDPGRELPIRPMNFNFRNDQRFGEIYIMNHSRAGSTGYDLFAPIASLSSIMDQLLEKARSVGGGVCGWQALEIARVEAGIPRFGVDIDETNLAPEAGIEDRAISYSKGCYIGQEVIARIRTYGEVARVLRGLRLPDDLVALPIRGDKLFKDGKEIGGITSAVRSPALKANVALGYVRREHKTPGNELTVRTAHGDCVATVVPFPFGA